MFKGCVANIIPCGLYCQYMTQIVNKKTLGKCDNLGKFTTVWTYSVVGGLKRESTSRVLN